MKSLDYATQKKTKIPLRGKETKHLPKSDSKRSILGTEEIIQTLPQLRKPLS